jgi:hypothetical protein
VLHFELSISHLGCGSIDTTTFFPTVAVAWGGATCATNTGKPESWINSASGNDRSFRVLVDFIHPSNLSMLIGVILGDTVSINPKIIELELFRNGYSIIDDVRDI